MSGDYLPWLGVPLERRLMGFRTGFAAVLIGDPLLAVAVALRIWRIGAAPPGGPAGPWWGLASSGAWLCFGLQWRRELRAGFSTRRQALAPTKIWHQLAVYPLLGYWLWTAGVGGFPAPGARASDVTARVLIVAGVAGWAVINGYDRRRPKLGHPPYDWRRLRPLPQPWPTASRALRAYRSTTGAKERIIHR
ncbi:hypothetical protein AB0D42_36080 [Streptomyces sp. NPDC048304]|uniref:hypothetical protein n=1 Tax=Streptomyces sp. NPDC048304 TaxID=3154820 RepID=UPI00340EDEC6